MDCSTPGSSQSSTTSCSLLKFMSIESVMLSDHFILCNPLHLLPSSIPSIRVFSNESDLSIRWPKYLFKLQLQHQSFQWLSQGWFPIGLTGLISVQSKGLSIVFSSTTIRKHQFFSAQPSLHGSLLTLSKHDYWKNHSFD